MITSKSFQFFKRVLRCRDKQFGLFGSNVNKLKKCDWLAEHSTTKTALLPQVFPADILWFISFAKMQKTIKNKPVQLSLTNNLSLPLSSSLISNVLSFFEVKSFSVKPKSAAHPGEKSTLISINEAYNNTLENHQSLVKWGQSSSCGRTRIR